MKWFGESWGAPVCDPDDHVEPPVGMPCARCDRAIIEDDQGVFLPLLTMKVEPDVAGVLEVEVQPWHLDCFLRSVGAVPPECPECHVPAQHKLQCSRRGDGGQLKGPSRVLSALQRAAELHLSEVQHTVSNPLVHILHEGVSLCGKPGLPRDWEPGHVWVHASDADKATCEGCAQGLWKLEPPKETGTPARDITLEGMVFPWIEGDSIAEDGPVLLGMPGSTALYLPCFERAADLEALMDRLAIPYSAAKQISNTAAFLESKPRLIGERPLEVIVNPHFMPDGKFRFMRVLIGN